ncbi:ankyrin repeat domain-containing protein 54-like [Anneissia japonica]|uniref:ankyrin repeat domain-containing protein 54-like n=1 Tax=Anneissia japonica TaxID=1529436 RepID=UPI0014257EED|nr:ankyrin repeat domain-containing protein 54-like [Anneissia japonica]
MEDGNVFPQVVRPKTSTFPTLASVASAAAISSSSCTSRPAGLGLADSNADQRKVTFDFSNLDWSPEPPAGIHFLGIQPKEFIYSKPTDQQQQCQDEETAITSNQHEFTGKVRRKKSRLQSRRGAIFLAKSPMSLDIIGERKLRKAANCVDIEEVGRLLKDEVNPNRCDDKGRTALHFASSKGSQAIVQLLLNHGADPNKIDVIGNTPLHLAAIGSHIGTVLTLLQNRADAHALDRSGRTPIHLASMRISHIRDQSFSSWQLKNEVNQVINMLKAYMNCLGKEDKVLALESMSLQLEKTTSKEEMDEVQSMLEGFTTMSLES